MRRTTIICIILLTGSTLFAQKEEWQAIIVEKVPVDLRISSKLYQLGRLAQIDADAARKMAISMHYPMRDDGRVCVELIAVVGKDIDVLPARSAGIEVNTVWRDRASVWIRLDRMIELARTLSDRYSFESSDLVATDNEGPVTMRSDSYITGGGNGSGIKIAIIDMGFDTLTEAISAGVVPGGTINTDWIGTGLEAGTIHGTGCFETIYDHAPQATYYLHRASNGTHLGAAVDDAITNGVNIISCSLSFFNTGWNDDDGAACAAINLAAQNGILCFVSSGNYADGGHYQGGWTDGDNDNWLNWNGGNEADSVLLWPGSTIALYMQWAGTPHPANNDYDLYLYDNATAQIVATSLSSNSYESLSWTNVDTVPHMMYVRVFNFGTGTSDLEIFNSQHGRLQTHTPSSSTTSPSNCTEPNVLSIGAAHFNDYGDPSGTSGIITDYSSQGPSNNGMVLPDLTGPTSTTTFAYGEFTGTSCSTPNSAGAAAAFWSTNSGLNADGVRLVLTRMAHLYKDWGAAGKDNIYGHGGLFLKTYTPNTRYILQGSGNTNGTPALPYSSIQQANQYAPLNSNMFFLGGTYNAPPVNTVIYRPMIFRSVVEGAVVE